jgi:hypothetical protein
MRGSRQRVAVHRFLEILGGLVSCPACIALEQPLFEMDEPYMPLEGRRGLASRSAFIAMGQAFFKVN